MRQRVQHCRVSSSDLKTWQLTEDEVRESEAILVAFTDRNHGVRIPVIFDRSSYEDANPVSSIAHNYGLYWRRFVKNRPISWAKSQAADARKYSPIHDHQANLLD